MTRTVLVELFQFDELSDAAKERARDWYRTASEQDEWWDSVYEDAETIAALMGIEIAHKGAHAEPSIFFSGFSSQGDGACLEGRYAYAKGGAAKVRDHAPVDAELHRIADGLQALQKANGYKLTATVEQSGHYSHSGCTDIDVSKGEDWAGEAIESEVKSLLRAFMDWIYRQLQAEYDALNEDEAVEDNIRANEYEFEADGRRARHG